MSTPSPAHETCPQCGAPLADDAAAAAFCPGCMWRELLEDDDVRGETAPADARFVVAGHDVLEEIARGGGGIVYRARQREPRREVALKMLLPQQSTSDEMHARFRVETSAIAALEHRAILPVYGVGEHRGMPFFTMKLATGGTLASRREAIHGDWRAIAQLLATLADAVHFAHARGVIHRDLKPGNVLFDDAGQPYVSDFGLAKFLEHDAAVTRTLASFGTPAYIAPEIVEHGGAAATTATDVYGLGAVLYELLAGRPPFAGDALPALMRRIVEEAPVSPRRIHAAVPHDLEVIALRCLEKDPARRLESAGEVAADLRRWLEGRPVLARPVAPAERLWRWARRNPALSSLSLLLTTSLVAGAVLLARSNTDLRHASERAQAAERDARERLQASLINEARITRRTGQVGQRETALALLDRAAAIGSTVRLRSEYIATLVRRDLTIEHHLPTAHARSDTTVDFSPDLRHVVEAADPHGLVERDVAGGEIVRAYAGQPMEVWYPGYAADGKVVTAAYRDGRIDVWDRGTDVPWWSGGGIYGGDAQPAPFAVHPDGRSVVWVAQDHAIHTFDRARAEVRTALPAAGEVRVLSFNGAGDVLLVVGREGATAWSWPEGKPLWTTRGPMSPTRPAWTADGRRVAVGWTGDDDVAVLDVRTGRLERAIAAHGGEVRLLAFHPDGRLLASVAWDGRLALHEVSGGERVLQREAWVRALRFSSDGRHLAFSRNHVEATTAALADVDCLLEFGAEQVVGTMGCRLALSADGRWLASTDFAELRLWDARSRELVARDTAPIPREPTAELQWAALAFTPAGDALIESRRHVGVMRRSFAVTGTGDDATAVLGAPQVCGPGRTGDLLRVDTRTGDWWLVRFQTGELVVWPGGQPEAERVVFQQPGLDGSSTNPGATLATARNFPAAGVQIVDTETGRAVTTLPAGRSLSALFTPDGASVVTGNAREYRVWRTGTWEPGVAWPARIEGGSYGGTWFSPDGRIVAVLQGRGLLELRETTGWEVLLDLELPQDWWVNHVVWAPDGSRIYVLCSGHRVVAWDLPAVRRELAARGLNWAD